MTLHTLYKRSSYVLSQYSPSVSGRRRKIRLIEGNAKCRHLKRVTWIGTLRRVFICLRPPPLPDYCLGWSGNFIGSESGQIQSVQLLQNVVSNRTQHPPPPLSHTLFVYTVLWHRTWGHWGGAIVHKAGSKIPTWLPVSQINTCCKVHLQVNFFRWRHLILVSL